MMSSYRWSVLVACVISVSAVAQQAPDQDRLDDGIPLAWKQRGTVRVSLPNGKKLKLNLAKDGPLSKTGKDVFVWVAWMEDAGHSHRPDPRSIDIVRQAFAMAPIKNADGTTGLRLHVYFAPKPVAEKTILGRWDASGYVWDEFDAIKAATFPRELNGIFHFCLFAHGVDPEGHSGLSRDIGAYDSIVSLGQWAPVDSGTVAGTFMHELGHNLGLRHGGTDDLNWKPNYLSVMNYFWQTSGLVVGGSAGHYDYSRFSVDIDESKLDKIGGISAPGDWASMGVLWYCRPYAGDAQSADSINGPIPWDCGYSGPDVRYVAQDVNDDKSITVLKGAGDWDHIRLSAYGISAAGAGATKETGKRAPPDELTVATANAIPLPRVAGVSALLQNGGVALSWKSLASHRVVGYKVFKRAEDGSSVLLGQTEAERFVDPAPQKGRNAYTVSAIYAPFGEAVDVIRSVGNKAKLIVERSEVDNMRSSLSRLKTLESSGIKTPQAIKPYRVLLETKHSASATITVE